MCRVLFFKVQVANQYWSQAVIHWVITYDNNDHSIRGGHRGERIVSPTLWCYSQQSHPMSLHAGSLPVPSNFQQEGLTFAAMRFVGIPLASSMLGYDNDDNNNNNDNNN